MVWQYTSQDLICFVKGMSIQLKRQTNKTHELMAFHGLFFILGIFIFISKIYFKLGLLFSMNIIPKLNFQEKNNHAQKIHSTEAGEMVQLLRAFAILDEKQSLAPNTHGRQLTTACNSACCVSNDSFTRLNGKSFIVYVIQLISHTIHAYQKQYY